MVISSTARPAQWPQANLLLAAVNSDTITRLLPHLEKVEIPLGKVLYESGDTMCYAYFPLMPSCRCSM